MAEPEAPPSSRRRRRPLTRAELLSLGIIFTLVGLGFLYVLIPFGAYPTNTIIVYVLVAFVGLWFGGVLMGRARGAP